MTSQRYSGFDIEIPKKQFRAKITRAGSCPASRWSLALNGTLAARDRSPLGAPSMDMILAWHPETAKMLLEV